MTTNHESIRNPRGWRRSARYGVVMAGVLALGACGDLDIVNTNAPTVSTLTGAPTRDVLARAATGIFSQAFSDIGTEIQFYALYGREGYNLLGNDPRETGEQIRGPQDPTGRNSGIWQGPYTAIRTINVYLEALPNATGMTDAERSASAGFAKTLKAWHIHRLAVRTGELGIALDVDRPLTAEPAPFVSFAAAMEAASALMDEALGNLNAGGTAFPFSMAPGFTGFNTPASFARFNRALAAKILVHRATFVGCEPCWNLAATALAQSFVTDQGLPESLDLGVEYHISTATGIPANPVSEPLTNERLWVHASIVDGAQLRQDGSPDLRLTRKVIDAGRTNELEDLVGRYKPILYNQPGNPAAANLAAPIPWISNEELLLLRAETRWHTGDRQGALGDIDLVRIHSGGLPTTTLTPGASTEDFVTELLYNRVYSLMWAQGTRWIDARRYNRLGTLPIDRPGDSVFENMLVPADECAARSLSPPCTPL
jgi:starch-binding outer membrane protein, SusD/RagB family